MENIKVLSVGGSIVAPDAVDTAFIIKFINITALIHNGCGFKSDTYLEFVSYLMNLCSTPQFSI